MKLQEKVSRLILAKTKGIGPSTYNKLCENFQENITTLLELKGSELIKLLGQKFGRALIEQKKNFNEDKFINNLTKREINFCIKGEAEYPTNLAEVSDFPIVLYYKGKLETSALERSIAIVGTRSNTQYGKEMTQQFVKGLVNKDFPIVSGLAMGIDYIAQTECIKNSGYTAAVIPSSPDNPIPKINTKLYNQILEAGGVIISEESDCFAEIRPEFFAKRNRIVAGISIATLIVEADIKSGALITANNAFDNNRMVFAIPGNIYQQKSRGVNKLIKDNKAKLTENVDDILIEFGYPINSEVRSAYVPKNEIEAKVIKIINEKIVTTSELSRTLNIDVSTLNSCISILEIEGTVAKDNKGNIRCMV